ncbi:EAL domain-containing protein [Paraneptunicella aestuarii]|uniref:putative bifunctional diguanylate cyclase/phosphodiesterase n=1 Tax=Paraneptunicella aestuarii TaxID=2831148 RepID=UPI001E34380E|nr:bifunctional diguanylate cyclase/phosphodiesterase [Paraneptunicella aestuarii]UAA40154.1 EAL domain-containing protein [Paraneptunicella aestuarii]
MIPDSIKSKLHVTLLFSLLLLGSGIIAAFMVNFRQIESESLKSFFSQIAAKTSDKLGNLSALEYKSSHPTFLLHELVEINSIKAGFVFNTSWDLMYQHVNPMYAREVQQYMYRLTDPKLKVIDVMVAGGDIYVVQEIGRQGSPDGYLMVVGDYDGLLDNRMRELLLKTLSWILPALFLLVIFGFYLQRKILFPMERLVAFATALKEKQNMDSRLDEDSSEEDFNTIARTFNWVLNLFTKEKDKHNQTQFQLKSVKNVVERISNHEQITGLIRRNQFMDLLQEKLLICESDGNDVGLFFIDLDNFSSINRSYGYEFGDKVLSDVACTILNLVGTEAHVCRLANDKFLVFLIPSSNSMSITLLVQGLVKNLNGEYIINDRNVRVGASIGIAFAKDVSYQSNKLLENAELAMQQVKKLGKGGYTYFDKELLERARRERMIYMSFDAALKNQRLDVFYQPKVNVRGELLGFEALARWEHEELGEIRPAEFVPVIEANQMAFQLTSWVLERVVIEADVIQTMLKKKLLFTVNLTHSDLLNPEFVPFVENLFKDDSLSPSCIEFDIVESALNQYAQPVYDTLNRLKGLGFSIALDSFGTVYSSIGNLVHNHIDTIKLDKSWMDALGNGEREMLVISSMIEMAHNLNLSVCAEGIETTEQFKMMVGFGCEALQGYLFGRPMPIDKIPGLFSRVPAYSASNVKTG